MNNNNKAANPQLSVILVTPDSYTTIRKTVTCLRKQTARDKLELIIVCTSSENLNINETELEDLLTFKIIEVGEILSRGHANAAGVFNATAPVIAFGEDHCYPHKTWAEALIEAHRQPWAAVGPVVLNANPRTMISRGDILIGYGEWLEPAVAGIAQQLPGHNSSYKRSVLLEYGNELESLLEAECVLHWDLRAKGHQLYLEPAAKMTHVNFSKLSAFIKAQFLNGRLFAATRIKKISAGSRMIYVMGAPLIPFVRLWYIFRNASQPGRSKGHFFKVLPVILLGLLMDGLGQFAGYVFGEGDTSKSFLCFEFHRNQHLAKKESNIAT